MDIQNLAIGEIQPNPNQPRKFFTGMEELASSIKTNGLLEPIMVRPSGEHFEIIHGERRWRAAKIAGFVEIAAIVNPVTDNEAYEAAIIENVQRENLTAIEEAQAFAVLQSKGYTQEKIARLVGKGQSYVAHKLRLLKMPEPITSFLANGSLTENHIRQIARLEAIYGTDLLRGFPAALDLRGKIKTEVDALTLLAMLRPEGRVPLFPINDTILNACKLFADYVSKHNASVKQWEVAGFFFACLAIAGELSVADLTIALNKYQQRYESCILMWSPVFDGVDHAIDVDAIKDGWDIDWPECKRAIYHDLRHSASLSKNQNMTPGEKIMAYKKVIDLIDCGNFALPSELQFKHMEGLTPVEWGAL